MKTAIEDRDGRKHAITFKGQKIVSKRRGADKKKSLTVHSIHKGFRSIIKVSTFQTVQRGHHLFFLHYIVHCLK